MHNIYNDETPFYARKKVDFLLADIGIFMDFLVLEMKKTEMCSADSCRSSILKKEQEKESKKLNCPVHQIKKCKKKRQDSFRVCSFYIHGKAHAERCANNKRKVEA